MVVEEHPDADEPGQSEHCRHDHCRAEENASITLDVRIGFHLKALTIVCSLFAFTSISLPFPQDQGQGKHGGVEDDRH